MKLKPSGTTFLASGVVQANVVLPKGITVGMTVYKVLPDVIIFDGEVPSSIINWSDSDDLPPEMPLPDPLPERAFGHIRPRDWLPSVSEPIELQEEEGSAYTISARVVDVPLEVLPGRQKQFSNFVGRVCFHNVILELWMISSVFVGYIWIGGSCCWNFRICSCDFRGRWTFPAYTRPSSRRNRSLRASIPGEDAYWEENVIHRRSSGQARGLDRPPAPL
jgi:hypothetical protein